MDGDCVVGLVDGLADGVVVLVDGLADGDSVLGLIVGADVT